uniref:Uncharacterized protein n=1 Tax=Lactuca sativa TaxID=4236 RepID=A0A9R1WZ06_LACSA|nr:hypothetical protein LSAT_V11C800403530 [Lactuca sativa]
MTEGKDGTSFGSKRTRNVDGKGRIHIDINDERIDLEDEQPRRNRARKAASNSSSSVHDHFAEKFDRYVQVQERKAVMMTWVEEKIIDMQTLFQTKNDLKILKIKAVNYEGKDLRIFLTMKESV